jgi:NAD(P)-dependent dehydrogenase (short-subunit alcohol dehydrogenase family)
MNLANTVALITGGKRFGGEIADALARGGADVALSYARSRDEAMEVSERVRAAGRRSAVFAADLSDPDQCALLIARVVETFGRIDVLIHMASVYVRRSFDELTLADWSAAVDIDLRAAFLCARAAVPHMRRAGGGRIINFSDWLPRSGRPRYHGFLPYYVAKAGVAALTEAMALELAADNILVNAIAPGPILAPKETTPEEIRAVEQATPLGRWGGPAEVAKVIMMLLETDFVTGETIRVDGGRHLK